MSPHEQPCDHLVSVMKKPEVKVRLIAIAARIFKRSGLDGSAEGLAQDAYAIALRNICNRRCNYDPSRPTWPFLRACVLNAAKDMIRAERRRRTVPLEDDIDVPANPASQSPEMPNLDGITAALQKIKHKRYQAVAAQIVASQLPNDEATPPAILCMAQSHPLPDRITANLKKRSLDAFREKLALLSDPEARGSSALSDQPPSQHS